MRDWIVSLLTCSVMLLLIVGGGGWALVTWGPPIACQHLNLFCPPAPGEQELAPYIDQYLAAAGAEIDAEHYTTFLNYEPPLTTPPYRIGRIAAVNVVDRVIDGKLTRALPAEMVATGPAEVGTVVWVRWGESHEGTYHDEGTQRVSGEAYRGYCAVVVIDLAAGEIVGRAYYDAPSPPVTTTGSGDVHTEVDVELVANWIKTLPLRDSSPTPAPPTPAPSPSGAESAALQPGESVTLSGDQSERKVVVPADRFELLAGDYSVVFEGRASKGCRSCMTVKVLNELVEYPIFVVNEPARISAGPWNFTGVFTLAWWEWGTFNFELTMPEGTWTITLTRDS